MCSRRWVRCSEHITMTTQLFQADRLIFVSHPVFSGQSWVSNNVLLRNSLIHPAPLPRRSKGSEYKVCTVEKKRFFSETRPHDQEHRHLFPKLALLASSVLTRACIFLLKTAIFNLNLFPPR